jgi:hypothetical protein
MSACHDCGEVHTAFHACEPISWRYADPPAPTCPDCGGTFTIDPDAEMSVTMLPSFYVPGADLRVEMVRAIVAFCNDCEFSIVLQQLTQPRGLRNG